MTAPPGALSTPRKRRNHVAEDRKSNLLREARLLLDACGIARGGNWISRVVRDYLDSALTGMPFGIYLTAKVELSTHQRRLLADRADLRYLLCYADPTGETAVRNVMREQRR